MGGKGSKANGEVKVIAVAGHEAAREAPSPIVKTPQQAAQGADALNPFELERNVSGMDMNNMCLSLRSLGSDGARSSAEEAMNAWGEVMNAVARPSVQHLSTSLEFPDSQLPSAVPTEYAHLTVTEPPGLRASAEAGRGAQLLLECLEIRKRYVGPQAGKHIEPKTVRFTEKDAAKVTRAALCKVFDGEAQLTCAPQEHNAPKRISWDPSQGEPPPRDPALHVACEDGIFVARDSQAGNAPVDAGAIVDVAQFGNDYLRVLQTMRDRSCISFCQPRLQELELRYQFYSHRNGQREAQRQKEVVGRDWYQVRKVDTHIHHSACFSQRQLMTFIRRKMTQDMNKVVCEEDGKKLTLREVFSGAGIQKEEEVNVENLCCRASLGNSGQHDTFGRFDVFNSKYNPFGDKRLRDIFLKADNYIDGSYLAELTKEVMASYAQQKFVCAEWRISIYGRKKDEWVKLAKWFRKYDIRCPQVRWLIQVPRLYPVFRKAGIVANFAEMLANIFEPLFEASIDPASHDDIFFMLQQVVGFDSVDDESQGTNKTMTNYPTPEKWTELTNPPYTYWMYHMYANIRSLNALRRRRGLNTFTFRPHCGEAGNVSHLVSGFMLTDGIGHGVMLKETPVLEYLFYLAQVGLHVSPLSNDILFIPLEKSPFGRFFRRGLNVSLSTDDPLIIHLTEEALIEEYVVAARFFRLSSCDLCEIARNSVLQSGFERAFKEWWVGSAGAGAAARPSTNPFDEEANGEHHMDERKSNVPTMRLKFRADTLRQEMDYLASASRDAAAQAPSP